VTPVWWDQLDVVTESVDVAAFVARMTDDVFDAEVGRIGSQRLGRTLDKLGVKGGLGVTWGAGVPVGEMVSGEGHGQILAAVRAILADERAHSAAEICASAIARGLLPAST